MLVSWWFCGQTAEPAAPASPDESALCAGTHPSHAPPFLASPRPGGGTIKQQFKSWFQRKISGDHCNMTRNVNIIHSLPKRFDIRSVFSSSWYCRASQTKTYITVLASDLVDVRDELPFMRHIGFLVVGSEFTLDGKKKDFKIPFLLEPAQESQHSSKCSY